MSLSYPCEAAHALITILLYVGRFYESSSLAAGWNWRLSKDLRFVSAVVRRGVDVWVGDGGNTDLASLIEKKFGFVTKPNFLHLAIKIDLFFLLNCCYVITVMRDLIFP